MLPPFITHATKTRQLNLWEFTRLIAPVYAGSPTSSWMHPHFIRGNIDRLCQITRVEVKGDQNSSNHISTIPTPIAAIRTAKHHSRRATLSQSMTLTTELSTFVPTSKRSRRATLPTVLPSFVQYNNNMQSTDIAQQAPPMLAHTLAALELSSLMHSSISSTSTPHDPSSYTENDMKLCLLDILSEDFLND